MIVQRILDQAAVRRSADGATSAEDAPPPYPGTSSAQRKASRPSSPPTGQTGTGRSAPVSRQSSRDSLSQVCHAANIAYYAAEINIGQQAMLSGSVTAVVLSVCMHTMYL